MKFLFILLISCVNKITLIPLEKTNGNPVLLISLDGFQANILDKFLKENPNSNFKKFSDSGVKANYMQPSFPTLTFPNHYTIVTGLYMENHGVTANTVYDSLYDEKLSFTGGGYLDKTNVKWWNQTEPIWLSAKNQGLKTASFFWAGSEVWQRHPDFFLKYDGKIEWKSRCDQIVSWFTKFEIDFATLYFDEPDHTGHQYGPDSVQYLEAVQKLDNTIGYLIEQLRKNNLDQIIDILIVSDHGMVEMKKTLLIQDYFDINLIDLNKTVLGIVSNIHPASESEKEKIYQELKKVDQLDVYYKEEVPENFHYRKSNRIAPIVVIAKEGYELRSDNRTLTGNHGFDNELESMRTIFMARGPSFRPNAEITSLKNVDVYPLLCKLTLVNCHPHNGSLVPFENILIN